jgi:hypothetical protein
LPRVAAEAYSVTAATAMAMIFIPQE